MAPFGSKNPSAEGPLLSCLDARLLGASFLHHAHLSHPQLSSLLPFLSKYCGHAFDYALDSDHPFFQCSGLLDEIQYFMKDQKHAMVGFSCRDLEEAAVCGEGEQSALLARHGSLMQQISLVPYNDDRCWCGQLPSLADELHLLPDHLETGAVTDAVDQDHAVCPLKLLVTDGFSRFAALERQNSKIKITLTSPSKHDPKNLHECIQVVKMIQIGFNIFHQGKKRHSVLIVISA